MPTSGSFDFSMDNSDFIAEAFERVGVDPDSITARKAESAIRSLNLLFSDWNTRGVKQYKVETITLTAAEGFVTGAQSITLNPRVIRILYAFHRQGSLDIPLYEVGRQDYQDMADKTISGDRPDRWFLDRQRDAAVMYLWPTIDNDNDSLVLSALVRTQNAGNLSDTPDVHAIWFEAVASGLAAKLALKYNKAEYDRLSREAESAFLRAKSEDRATGPTRIRVSYGRNRRRK